jgi:Flp pilus assembly protein TadD
VTAEGRAVPPRRRSREISAAGLIVTLGALGLAGCATTTTAIASQPSGPGPAGDVAVTGELLRSAARARHYEDHGEYAAALTDWRSLRLHAPADGDLELAIAINEARSGQLDSAAARLSGPKLSAAALDTLPTSRYQLYYPAGREALYVNGTFDGWHWYVWRARAEVAARRESWEEATVAARRCVAARPTNGKQWLLLAVCAGQAGHADEARAAARSAVTLDGGVPEAHYLDALWAWKDGRRAAAQAGFRASVALDSTFRPGATALLRSRLPGTPPDPLPTGVLTGPREVGMLTSPLAPKVEEYVALEQAPIVASRTHPALPDSIKAQLQGKRILVWLFIDADGRVALADLAWYPAGTIPTPAVSEFMALVPTWRFMPARVQGTPRGVWADFTYAFPR